MKASATSLLWINTFLILPKSRIHIKEEAANTNFLEKETSNSDTVLDKKDEEERVKIHKLLKSPIFLIFGIQFFLGSLRVYSGTSLMVNGIVVLNKLNQNI